MHNTFTCLGFEYNRGQTFASTFEIEEDLIEEVARLYGYEKVARAPLARIAMKSPKD